MRIHQVEYFLAVSEEGNFTRAAERCAVKQPSLTLAIQVLETELGGRLFHRGRRGARLSELGRALLPVMQQIHAALERAADIAREHRSRAAGRPGSGQPGCKGNDCSRFAAVR